MGSLVAAVASYCDAKANHGKWLVRIEDVDTTREIQGAAQQILSTLDAYGFEWDSEVAYQSQRSALHQDNLTRLAHQFLVYPCTCTRKEIADSSQQHGVDGVIYPNTCLTHPLKTQAPQAWRVKTTPNPIAFEDAIQGHLQQTIATEVGDFIIKRADGLFAYQLAVVVDDALQGITHVVRGADLLDSTPRQIYLQQLLGFATPHYAHVPVVCNAAGEKLSKQTLAQPLDATRANIEVFEALSFLGQQPPEHLKDATLDEIWRWAIQHWQLNHVPKQRGLPWIDQCSA
jgi:glutamyl-Q tRNA(Asp) synthetase